MVMTKTKTETPTPTKSTEKDPKKETEQKKSDEPKQNNDQVLKTELQSPQRDQNQGAGSGRGGFMNNRGRGRFEGGRGGGRGRFEGGRGGRGGRYNGGQSEQRQGGGNDQQRPQAQQQSEGSQQQGSQQQVSQQQVPQQKVPQQQVSQQQVSQQQPEKQSGNESGRGGYRGGRGGYRGGRGGGNDRGERREKVIHPPAQFTEDGERMFTGRCRLFIGNLPQDTSQDEFEKLFEPYGAFQEAYISPGRGFGFIRLDTRAHAVTAKKALDGEQKKGRFLRVRFASHAAALKVKHLHPFVSNELLEEAFSMFGEVEKSIVIIDDKGRPTGEGIIEFVRKPGALMAMNRINEGVFLLGSSPRPIVVEPLVENDEEDGLPEKFMGRNVDYAREREHGARFAPMNSFEYEFAHKWKEMYMMHNEAEENLKRQFQENVAKLEIEQANSQMEYQTQKLREDLVRRQEELRKMEESHQRDMQMKLEMRHTQEESRRKIEESRKREEEENRLKLERYQQQQDERARHQQEMQLRELQEMRQMREELSQMRQQTQQRQQGGVGMMSGGARDDDMMGGVGIQGDIPAMKPPPAPPAALTLERSRQAGVDVPSLLGMSGRGGGQRGGGDRGNVQMDRGSVNMDRGNVNMDRGNVNMDRGNTNMDRMQSNMGNSMGNSMVNRQGNMDRGMGGGGGGGGNSRQSRFEQNSGGNGFSQQGGMGGLGRMDRRDRPDDFFDAKRARRF